jgi:hypothetical protein
MSTLDWPAAEAEGSAQAFGFGAGSDFIQHAAVGAENWRSPIAESLAGWMCLAECAADVSPGIAHLMRSAGQLVRCAAEKEAIDRADALIDAVSGDSYQEVIPRRMLAAAVRQMLEANCVPLSPELAARQLDESIQGLRREDLVLLAEHSVQPDLAADELASRAMVPAGARIASEAAGVLPPRPGQPPDEYYFGGDQVRWFFTASLELPRSIGGHLPVRCFKPRHKVMGDNVCITESTYNNVDVDNEPLIARQGRTGEIGGGYRPTLDEDEVNEFANILPQELRQKSYVCRTVINPDSAAIRTVGQAVSDHRSAITQVAKAAADAATLAIGALHPAALPLTGLLDGLAANITNHLIDAFGRLIAPRSLPAWVISHSVVWAEADPLSVFLLYCPDEPRRYWLHAIRQSSEKSTKISAEYPNLDKDLYFHGRLMWGASRPNDAFPSMPADLWSVVDEHKQPVIWTTPEYDKRGFRVLVPQQRDGTRYVTALRADIRFNKAPAAH